MTANQIKIVDGPDRLGFYGSMEHGTEILFHFNDKDVAKFIVAGAEIEGGERHSWNIKVTLSDCSQSLTLKNGGFANGDCFHGFYTVLHSRKGFLMPIKPWFHFSGEINNGVFDKIASSATSFSITIPFGNGTVAISSSYAIVNDFDKSVMFKGSLITKNPADLFGQKMTRGQEVKGFYDFRNKAGFIWVDD